MNIHSQIKKHISDYKNVISDNEVMAVNKLNRYIGEVGIAEGFMSLSEDNARKLSLQDYEFYSNTLAIAKLVVKEELPIKVINLSNSTVHWAINFSLSTHFLNGTVTFRNKASNVNIAPTSAFARETYQVIQGLNTEPNYDLPTKLVVFVDALDELIWNSVLEQLSTHYYHYVFIKNFNNANVLEEPLLIAKSKFDLLQSITGWAMMS